MLPVVLLILNIYPRMCHRTCPGAAHLLIKTGHFPWLQYATVFIYKFTLSSSNLLYMLPCVCWSVPYVRMSFLSVSCCKWWASHIYKGCQSANTAVYFNEPPFALTVAEIGRNYQVTNGTVWRLFPTIRLSWKLWTFTGDVIIYNTGAPRQKIVACLSLSFKLDSLCGNVTECEFCLLCIYFVRFDN